MAPAERSAGHLLTGSPCRVCGQQGSCPLLELQARQGCQSLPLCAVTPRSSDGFEQDRVHGRGHPFSSPGGAGESREEPPAGSTFRGHVQRHPHQSSSETPRSDSRRQTRTKHQKKEPHIPAVLWIPGQSLEKHPEGQGRWSSEQGFLQGSQPMLGHQGQQSPDMAVQQGLLWQEPRADLRPTHASGSHWCAGCQVFPPAHN